MCKYIILQKVKYCWSDQKFIYISI